MTHESQQHFHRGVHGMGTIRHDVVVISEISEAFQARMEAQCEEIQRYRLKVKREQGRELNLEQAAREWIDSYADAFARDNDKL
jgi:hypothetical protein